MSNYILTATCFYHTEIIAVISGYLSEKRCEILEISQYYDLNNKKKFMRVNFILGENIALKNIIEDLKIIANQISLEFAINNPRELVKTIILVSRFDHCLRDLLYRWHNGALSVDIVGVISNHPQHQKLVMDYDLPFYYIPVNKNSKRESNDKLITIIEKNNVELLILARYMQILSNEICEKMSGRIINIHHSFLPSFKGANPYKQAHEAGVKMIGATAHYVTSILDEGPIIEQDTIRVTHAQNIADYVVMGRDLETKVLAYAVKAHIQYRVFINDKKTIVFPEGDNYYS
ncbi:formyltetrahydrofolate deformylase [Candidatus Liberibacter americanus]|uniref:Formyltetrahydrofolate deformylase n=1 Tax=Candidatus Liberibacter americanus str. Sao Paulo TaxID=1261131 RepID=U6B5K2_9HYPH|nr:formyltetrahydrofolate deformylase [Candidatus Liberibacter americanus]AHA28295.1 Formyltetrahydrofolate hydrolase [Candidatus Liberibacter americanus str. Sao Paulo]EMS36587.1 formyltetrahydrofolate deformylase [Candidatus Liberibacter americanus PW_SP]